MHLDWFIFDLFKCVLHYAVNNFKKTSVLFCMYRGTWLNQTYTMGFIVITSKVSITHKLHHFF